jgi:hypothetical protein
LPAYFDKNDIWKKTLLQCVTVIATRLFFENARLFFKNAWHLKDIFREFEAFLKISILFEDIFREIESFSCKAF